MTIVSNKAVSMVLTFSTLGVATDFKSIISGWPDDIRPYYISDITLVKDEFIVRVLIDAAQRTAVKRLFKIVTGG